MENLRSLPPRLSLGLAPKLCASSRNKAEKSTQTPGSGPGTASSPGKTLETGWRLHGFLFSAGKNANPVLFNSLVSVSSQSQWRHFLQNSNNCNDSPQHAAIHPSLDQGENSEEAGKRRRLTCLACMPSHLPHDSPTLHM